MTHEGSVTVETLKKKNKVRQTLGIERPLNREKIDEAMAGFFWFEDPVLRHVAYIRKYGKKTARAIMDHEVFVGMSQEAALESWGTPARVNTREISGQINEQWIYPTGSSKSKYIYVSGGKILRWED
jgi:hypothetical protein